MTLHIQLLGEFHLVEAGTPVTTVSGDRLQSLLGYLLIHRRAPQSRQQLAFLLWPDSPEGQARTNLRNLLHSLRRSLPHADAYLTADHMTLQWRGDAPYTLDVADFEAAAAAGLAAHRQGDAAAARPALEQAVAVYRGELLPGCYDDWLLPLREEMHHTYLTVLDALIDVLLALGDPRAAVRQAQRLVQADPLRESSYGELMRAYAMAGDRAGVTRTFQQCTRTLDDELGVEPSPATRQAHEHWLRHAVPMTPLPVPAAPDPTPPAAAPPPAVPLRAPLPAPTHFVGREDELIALTTLLSTPDCRLVTIVGPGGVGKTSLALKLATLVAPQFADGVVVVQLAGVAHVGAMPSVIAQAVNVRLSALGAPGEMLGQALAQQELLMVVDNLEHLLEGVDLLSDLLTLAPGLKIVATSRERLNLQEEWVFDLRGLSLAVDPAQPLGATENYTPAVDLFVYHARRAQRGFAPEAADLAAIQEICRLVEGMPLAIELAASWARMLSPAEIAQEIRRNLAFLATTARNVPDRHRSLQATFDHSWHLLDVDAQQLLAELSVFRGVFGREAAEAVTGATLPRLAALVDKSLLRSRGDGRFDLHELIRQYAALHLAAHPDAARAARTRHSTFYLNFLRDAADTLLSDRQDEVLLAIYRRFENIRVAWEWALQESELELVAAGARVLFIFIDIVGLFTEGIEMYRQALAAFERPLAGQSPSYQMARMRVLAGLGTCLMRRGVNDEADRLLTTVLEENPCHDPALDANTYQIIQDVHYYLAMLKQIMGDYTACCALMAHGYSMAKRRAGQEPVDIHMAMQLGLAGLVAQLRGHFAEAERLTRTAYEMLPKVGHPLGQWSIGARVAYLHWRNTGNDAQLVPVMQALLNEGQKQNDQWYIGTATHYWGCYCMDRGDYESAIDLLAQNVDAFQQLGVRWQYARGCRDLGFAYLAVGQLADAARWFARCWQLGQDARLHALNGEAQLGLAEVAWRQGDDARAWQLLTAALDLPPGEWEYHVAAVRLLAQLAPGQDPAAVDAATAAASARAARAMTGEIPF